jgi:hypothetical protein
VDDAVVRATLPRNPTLGNVFDRLSRVLDRATFSQRAVHEVPGGFVLVTQVDQFNTQNGRSISGQSRMPPPTTSWDRLWAALDNVLVARQGYFRIIVFAVAVPDFRPSGPDPNANEAAGWLQGAMALRGGLQQRPYGDQRLSVLIYEFRKTGRRVELLKAGSGVLPVQRHLSGAGINLTRS